MNNVRATRECVVRNSAECVRVSLTCRFACRRAETSGSKMQKARIVGRKEGWMRRSPFRLAPLLILALLYLGCGPATSQAATLPVELALVDDGGNGEPPDAPTGFGAIPGSVADDV